MISWWGHEELFKMNFEVEDLDLIGDHLFTLGVPWNASEEFKKKVMSAAKSYNLGIKSVDYTLKKYGQYWSFKPSIEKELNEAIQDLKRIIVNALDYLMEIPDKPDIPSLYFCGAALIRLQNTFKAALISIKSRLYFEGMSLERMILEQLAWIYKVHNMEDFFEVKPNKCIKDLKKMMPFVGRLYNYLSNGVHLSPKLFNEYIEKDLSIKMGDIKQSYLNLYILFLLADIFCIVGEYIYANTKLVTEYRYIECANGKLKPRDNRDTVDMIKKYQKFIKEENFLNGQGF